MEFQNNVVDVDQFQKLNVGGLPRPHFTENAQIQTESSAPSPPPRPRKSCTKDRNQNRDAARILIY